MTYRASLGTRGELRRIAAEAESATIEQVRPWHRKLQPCQLAPHVTVPQWIRSEHPPKPKTPPPRQIINGHTVAVEIIESLLESASKREAEKSFRKGRARKGRTRSRSKSDSRDDDVSDQPDFMDIDTTRPVATDTMAEAVGAATEKMRAEEGTAESQAIPGPAESLEQAKGENVASDRNGNILPSANREAS